MSKGIGCCWPRFNPHQHIWFPEHHQKWFLSTSESKPSFPSPTIKERQYYNTTPTGKCLSCMWSLPYGLPYGPYGLPNLQGEIPECRTRSKPWVPIGVAIKQKKIFKKETAPGWHRKLCLCLRLGLGDILLLWHCSYEQASKRPGNLGSNGCIWVTSKPNSFPAKTQASISQVRQEISQLWLVFLFNWWKTQ